MATNVEESKPINFVSQDEIWKTRLKVEKESSKIWPHKWGFLSEVYIESQRKGAGLRDAAGELDLPPHLRARPPTPAEKYIHVSPSPPVPQTTQALIGWRSSQPHLQLEVYGKETHGRRSFLKELGWTLESCT
ncbi:unnamed protein product [Boreogadus saida]